MSSSGPPPAEDTLEASKCALITARAVASFIRNLLAGAALPPCMVDMVVAVIMLRPCLRPRGGHTRCADRAAERLDGREASAEQGGETDRTNTDAYAESAVDQERLPHGRVCSPAGGAA